MASVKVAVRVRPLNKREIDLESKYIVSMDGNKTTIRNPKYAVPKAGDGSREALKDFTYDFSFWTTSKTDPKYASQHQVFTCLGLDVVQAAYDGYNACVFAYGQTGSGKTYTMMGAPDDEGLIPRICRELYTRMTDENTTYRCEVSYLEIYNEKVRDLLKHSDEHSLRVREHPKHGPYVEELSKHIVQNYKDIRELMDKGSSMRATACTNMNDTSSRSHAIFTIVFTQAKFSNDAPSETHSKIHLVDLAGSERAGATGATGQRLKEGGSINKSLVTLSKVISLLAERGERRSIFIPYRDSTLTWLLKDSLGGNSKTMMIATVSPADVNYGETLSTLRYANHAKNIINKPTVNEDPNVKLIRELREEIRQLRLMLGGNIDRNPKVKEKLHENEARVKVLTEQWAHRWDETASVLQEEGGSLALRREGGMGVVLDSELPHLIGIDDNLLSTGIMLYHLKQGSTRVGTALAHQQQDIVLQGLEVEEEHCLIDYTDKTVTLIPFPDSLCSLNGNLISEPVQLSQGDVIMMGRTNMFRFNFPEQAARLRQEYSGSGAMLSSLSMSSLLSQSMTDINQSTDNLAAGTHEMQLAHQRQLQQLETKRHEIEALEERAREAEAARLLELESRDQELGAARDQLLALQADAERSKHEVQQAHARLRKQEAKLKRRSRHVTHTLQRFLNKDGSGDGIGVTAGELRELIEAELHRLRERAEQQGQQLTQQQQQLVQVLSDLRSAHGVKLEEIESGMKDLLEKEEARTSELNTSQQQLHNLSSSIAELREQEDERRSKLSILQQLSSNPSDLSSVSAQLTSSQVSALRPCLAALNQQKTQLKDRDTLLFKLYKDEEQRIKAEHTRKECEIRERKERMNADKVYLTECTEALEEQLEGATSEQERDELEEDRKVVEEEWQRIDKDEQAIRNDENELSSWLERESGRLQETRDEQVVELNSYRDKVKEKEGLWAGQVETFIVENTSEMMQILDDINKKESMLEASNQGLEDLVRRQEVEREQEEERRLALEQQRIEEEESFKSSINEKEKELDGLQHQHETISQDTTTRKKILDELLWSDSEDEPNEDDIRDRLDQWNSYVKKYPDSQGEDDIEDSPENNQLLQKIQKLEELESQLLERNQEIDAARQQELDNIDVEKFRLQELEEQGRINALVEVEVRKRLMNERMQREKKRRAEKDRERQHYDKKLAKMNQRYHRQIHRMQQKYESTGNLTHIEENSPTRANPYADVMSGDATPVSGRPTASTSSNLVRARSLVSVNSISSERAILASIPGYVIRGGGFDTHVEYELQLTVGEESWTVFRRYSRFREMHSHLKAKYRELQFIVFPPKRWFSNKSERVINERKEQLQAYVQQVIQVLQRNRESPLHPSRLTLYSKQALWDLHPFFRRGVFENLRSGTG